MTKCTCESVAEAAELEWNPDCPEHGETAAADRVLAFLNEHLAARNIELRDVVMTVGDETLLAADLFELAYRAKSAKELRESQGPAEFEMLGDEFAETLESVAPRVFVDGREVMGEMHREEPSAEMPIAAQLSAHIEPLEMTGVPWGNPYPVYTGEIADEVVGWLDGMVTHAPGIHEAVASRLPSSRYMRTMHPEITKLAEFIMGEVPGEPSRSESAVECAIRLIKETQP